MDRRVRRTYLHDKISVGTFRLVWIGAAKVRYAGLDSAVVRVVVWNLTIEAVARVLEIELKSLLYGVHCIVPNLYVHVVVLYIVVRCKCTCAHGNGHKENEN